MRIGAHDSRGSAGSQYFGAICRGKAYPAPGGRGTTQRGARPRGDDCEPAGDSRARHGRRSCRRVPRGPGRPRPALRARCLGRAHGEPRSDRRDALGGAPAALALARRRAARGDPHRRSAAEPADQPARGTRRRRRCRLPHGRRSDGGARRFDADAAAFRAHRRHGDRSGSKRQARVHGARQQEPAAARALEPRRARRHEARPAPRRRSDLPAGTPERGRPRARRQGRRRIPRRKRSQPASTSPST